MSTCKSTNGEQYQGVCTRRRCGVSLHIFRVHCFRGSNISRASVVDHLTFSRCLLLLYRKFIQVRFTYIVGQTIPTRSPFPAKRTVALVNTQSSKMRDKHHTHKDGCLFFQPEKIPVSATKLSSLLSITSLHESYHRSYKVLSAS